MRFLAPDIEGEDRSRQFGTYSLINNNSGKNLVYIFLPEYEQSFNDVRKLYPKGEEFSKKDEDGSVLFFAYVISNVKH